MERNYLQSIKSLLDNTSELEAMPTGSAIKKYHDPSIRCILFDIYGTLLISASGDIDQAEVKTEFLQYAFEKAEITCDAKYAAGSTEADTLFKKLVDGVVLAIQQKHQEDKLKGINFPEIDILAIWQQVLQPYIGEGVVHEPTANQLKAMAFTFELLSNKLAPMPALQSVFSRLRTVGMPMGIVSNAQFYTPVIMNYYLHNQLAYTDSVQGFEPSLTSFSYKKLKAKPDPSLFIELVDVLRSRYGLEPHQVAFVGNDMLKDIYGASRAGFKTVLFAGDKRSLRLREEREETRDLQPDFVIDNLTQLLEICGLGMCSCNA